MKYNVEVFHTRYTGWGIRAKECIPKGAFVFEMIGETLNNAEMQIRNLVVQNGQSYALQLDANWATERNLDDNTALCLDSTHYGNVARFLNHSLDHYFLLFNCICNCTTYWLIDWGCTSLVRFV